MVTFLFLSSLAPPMYVRGARGSIPAHVLPRCALRPSAYPWPSSSEETFSEPLRSILDPGTLSGYTLFRERAGAVTQEPGLQADEPAAFHRAGAGGEQAPLCGGDLRPCKGGIPGSGTVHCIPDAGLVARVGDRAQGGLRGGVLTIRACNRADAPPRTLQGVRCGNRVQRRANGIPGTAGRAGDRFRHRLARDNAARSVRDMFLRWLVFDRPR